MKKALTGFFILGGVLLAIFLIMQISRPQQQQSEPTEIQADGEATVFPEPPPGAIVFDMKYRGFSDEDEMHYNSYSAFQVRKGTEEETPFLKALREDGKKIHALFNPNFGKAKWSAVEIKDNEASALYVDLNTDGKVSDNEKILPIEKGKELANVSQTSLAPKPWEFVTPDFVITTDQGRQVLLRALLQVRLYGEPWGVQGQWTPSCVLEGTSTIAGKSTKLILFANSSHFSFTEFGKCKYALIDNGEESSRNVSIQTLSSLVNHNGKYYRLKLHGAHEKDKTVRAVLEEYTGTKGQIAVKLVGNTNLQAKLSSARITGSEDKTLRFNLSDGQSVLPAESYKLSSGNINFGAKTADECMVSISEGPEFEIGDGETCNVELGKPVLSVSAVDENKRYQNDVKEQTVYTKGTNVFISRIIKGKGGELYGRFSQQDENSRSYKAIEPEIKIVDSEGKEVVAAKIKYG